MSRRIPRGMIYSVANFGTSLSSSAISTYVGFFYIAVVGLPPRWVGWGLFAFSWWNALNDPLAGWLSDRTHTRWGRRTPYIALLAVPLGISFATIWVPPLASGHRGWLFAYMMSTITVNDLLYTLVGLNVAALLPEMFPSLRVRARVNGWRQVMSLAGMLLGVTLLPLLAEQIGWPAIGGLFGLLTAGTVLLSLQGMREYPAYARSTGSGPVGSLRSALHHRSFVIFLGISFLIRLALTSINATMPFYASYVLGLGARGTAWLLGAALVMALLAMHLWGTLLTRWGARRTTLVAQVAVAVSVLPFLLAQTLPAAMIGAVLAGINLAGLQITPEVMLSDVIDADHVRTGLRQEGVYFGANNFVTRLPNVLQAVGVGEMLTLAGYNTGLAVQPPAVIAGLRFLIAVVPAVTLLLAAVLTWYYPLHGARLEQVKRQVAALRAKVEAEGKAEVEEGVS